MAFQKHYLATFRFALHSPFETFVQDAFAQTSLKETIKVKGKMTYLQTGQK